MRRRGHLRVASSSGRDTRARAGPKRRGDDGPDNRRDRTGTGWGQQRACGPGGGGRRGGLLAQDVVGAYPDQRYEDNACDQVGDYMVKAATPAPHSKCLLRLAPLQMTLRRGRHASAAFNY